jgi:hypothetical protein
MPKCLIALSAGLLVIPLVSLGAVAQSTTPTPAGSDVDDTTELAKKLQNPIGDLYLMTPLILRWHRTFVRRGVGRRASGRTAR